jgi:predicted Zn-dependent protease
MDRSLALQKTPEALLDRADIALAQNDSVLAGKRIDEALTLDPRNAAALVAKLNLMGRSGDAATALAFSEQAVKFYPQNVDLRAGRIRLFLALNQDAKARAEVDAILARSRGEPLGIFYQAVLLSRANDKTRALLLMQGLPSGFARSHPELALQMAQIALDDAKPEIASNVLSSALAADPDRIDVRLRLAQLRLDQESPQGALVVLGPVKDSTDPRVRQIMAKVNKAIARNRAF